MSAEKVMAAIGKINDKYIEENAVVKSVRRDKINQMVRRKWFIRLCACLAVIAIAAGIEIPLLNKASNFTPLTLNAYKIREDDNYVKL